MLFKRLKPANESIFTNDFVNLEHIISCYTFSSETPGKHTSESPKKKFHIVFVLQANTEIIWDYSEESLFLKDLTRLNEFSGIFLDEKQNPYMPLMQPDPLSEILEISVKIKDGYIFQVTVLCHFGKNDYRAMTSTWIMYDGYYSLPMNLNSLSYKIITSVRDKGMPIELIDGVFPKWKKG